jgi:hypothetical protein
MPVEAVIAAAREFLGDRITTNTALRDHHSHGQDTQPPVMPDAVAFIESTDEACRLMALCHAERVPVVPWGAGTSLEGHVTPVRGGITLDMSRMNHVLHISQPDMDCRVQAGVTRDQLNVHLRDMGLFFPVDPGTAACTIGGMSATRASGTNAVRYGTMRDNVMGLTVVMPDGKLIRTGGRVRKSSSGDDLTRLFVGSEGTLGIITEIQLRLHGIPEAVSSATCQFNTLRDAVETVISILQLGIPVARMELLDDVQMAACIAYSKLEGLAALPTLFFEFHGTEAGVAEQASQADKAREAFSALHEHLADLKTEGWKLSQHPMMDVVRKMSPDGLEKATDQQKTAIAALLQNTPDLRKGLLRLQEHALKIERHVDAVQTQAHHLPEAELSSWESITKHRLQGVEESIQKLPDPESGGSLWDRVKSGLRRLGQWLGIVGTEQTIVAKQELGAVPSPAHTEAPAALSAPPPSYHPAHGVRH